MKTKHEKNALENVRDNYDNRRKGITPQECGFTSEHAMNVAMNRR